MICISTPSPKPHLPISRNLQRPNSHRLALARRPIRSFLPNSEENPTRTSTHLLKPLKESPGGAGARSHVEGKGRMWLLCGIGYWVHGFRCFPWLALNFHMTHGMGLGPSTLQLVQNVGNLPMVAKPLYGVLSDAIYIGRAHRLPYISFGAILQVLSWGTLSLIPLTGDTFPTQMSCILLGNLGASLSEVVSDALVAEFSKSQKAGVLQSYAYMALAAGGILGNLSGGFFLLKSQQPKVMFLSFTLLLALQLALSLTTREDALCSSRDSNRQSAWSSITENLSKQLSNMVAVISDERILSPLSWIIASIATVPLLSGTMFCFHTQCLNLDPSIIGLSKVIGQLFFLSATFVYNRYLKRLPMRTLIFGVQVLYVLCLLSDLLLVKQINLQLGISNEAYVLSISALAEATAQFKILPFTVFLAKLCPSGCEGSLFAIFASALCLSSIFSGISGVGLANLLGLSTGSYAQLPLAIVLQSVAALVPLGFIAHVPMLQTVDKGARRSWKKMKLSRSRLTDKFKTLVEGSGGKLPPLSEFFAKLLSEPFSLLFVLYKLAFDHGHFLEIAIVVVFFLLFLRMMSSMDSSTFTAASTKALGNGQEGDTRKRTLSVSIDYSGRFFHAVQLLLCLAIALHCCYDGMIRVV